MTCPYLQKQEYVTCRACGALYMPSISELMNFCRRDDFGFCAYYRMSVHEYGKHTGPDLITAG